MQRTCAPSMCIPMSTLPPGPIGADGRINATSNDGVCANDEHAKSTGKVILAVRLMELDTMAVRKMFVASRRYTLRMKTCLLVFLLSASLPGQAPKVRLPDESAGLDGIARTLISVFDQVDIVALGETH